MLVAHICGLKHQRDIKPTPRNTRPVRLVAGLVLRHILFKIESVLMIPDNYH